MEKPLPALNNFFEQATVSNCSAYRPQITSTKPLSFLNQEESRLIKKCLKNDRKAQKSLFQLYFSYGMSITLRYARSRSEAEEILNDAFLKVFTNLSGFKIDAPFKPWFRRILVNTSIDFYRRELNHYHHLDISSAREEQVQENIYDRIGAEEILDLVQQLPAAYRLVFNLYVLEGYKHHEIAEMLQIHEGTSKSNLMKARLKLQNMIKKQEALRYGNGGI